MQAGGDTAIEKINLYFQRTPFEPHGFECKHSGLRFQFQNPVFTCDGGEWGPWTEWTTCSESCGSEGRKTRSRVCIDTETPCVGDTVETRVCNTHQCPSPRNALSDCSCQSWEFSCWDNSCGGGFRCERTTMGPS